MEENEIETLRYLSSTEIGNSRKRAYWCSESFCLGIWSTRRHVRAHMHYWTGLAQVKCTVKWGWFKAPAYLFCPLFSLSPRALSAGLTVQSLFLSPSFSAYFSFPFSPKFGSMIYLVRVLAKETNICWFIYNHLTYLYSYIGELLRDTAHQPKEQISSRERFTQIYKLPLLWVRMKLKSREIILLVTRKTSLLSELWGESSLLFLCVQSVF